MTIETMEFNEDGTVNIDDPFTFTNDMGAEVATCATCGDELSLSPSQNETGEYYIRHKVDDHGDKNDYLPSYYRSYYCSRCCVRAEWPDEDTSDESILSRWARWLGKKSAPLARLMAMATLAGLLIVWVAGNVAGAPIAVLGTVGTMGFLACNAPTEYHG